MRATKQAVIDYDKCRRCSDCKASQACPLKALMTEEGIPFVHGKCRGCGTCAKECPYEAVLMV